MKWFAYTATDGKGQTVEGRLRAESDEALRWKLAERGLEAGAVTPVDGPVRSSGFSADPRSWFGPRSINIELSLAQVAVMLRSGFTLLAAVETIIEQPPSLALRRIYRVLRDRISEGESLAEAMASLPCFPPSVVAMIGMGEESGNLDTVREQSAEAMEARRQSRTTTLTALFYPAFTFFLAIGVSAYLVIAIIPKMQKALDALGKTLPPMTQSLMDLSVFLTKWGLLLGVVSLSIFVSLVLIWLWPPGRLFFDRTALQVPVIGTILRTGASAVFSRSLSTLLSSGIPLVDGLRISASLHGNRYMAQVTESAMRRVLEGGTLYEGLDRPRAYLPMMLRMVAVGEVSGNLEETLGNAAKFHDEQLLSLVKRLSALLEPVVVIGVGTLVGYVYIAFFVGLYAAV